MINVENMSGTGINNKIVTKIDHVKAQKKISFLFFIWAISSFLLTKKFSLKCYKVAYWGRF